MNDDQIKTNNSGNKSGKKPLSDDGQNVEDEDVQNSDDVSFDNKTGIVPPGSAGEESISGSSPDTESIQDEDMLEHAHDVGSQMNEDDEHPEELDLGRDIDEAEIDKLEH